MAAVMSLLATFSLTEIAVMSLWAGHSDTTSESIFNLVFTSTMRIGHEALYTH